jgi:uncharacterized membrane protein YeaQ/YmgE (transglycosylase-associated protein family)
MNLVWITLIGLAAGLVARLVTAGKKGPFGFMLTILVGIIGAFVGPYFGQAAGWYGAEEPTGLVAAVVGAVLVVSIWAVLFRSGRPTSSL